MNIIAEIVDKTRKYQELTGKRAKKVKLGAAEYTSLRNFVMKEYKYDIDVKMGEKDQEVYGMKIIKSDKPEELSFI